MKINFTSLLYICLALPIFAQSSTPSEKIRTKSQDVVILPSLREVNPDPSLRFSKTIWVGTYETSCEEYIKFLNSADKNETHFVLPDGRMTTPAEALRLTPATLFNPSKSLNIEFNPKAKKGERYFFVGDWGRHPATGMSWYGAVAYCNWLTRELIGSDEVCYREGDLLTAESWAPVTIKKPFSNAIDLPDSYIRQLRIKKGFRLPLTDGDRKSGFNEYRQMAAWDGKGYLAYGNGLNYLAEGSCNYLGSNDVFEGGQLPMTTPGGYFAHERGTNEMNPWKIRDLAGNVWEWQSDSAFGNYTFEALIKGGSAATDLNTAKRAFKVDFCRRLDQRKTLPYLGFRIVTTQKPSRR